MRETVDHVAERAADNQAERQRQHGLVLMATQHYGQPGADHECEDGEKPALPTWLVGEKTERRPWVIDQYKLEKIRQGNGVAVIQREKHQPFRGLIGRDDERGQREPSDQTRIHRAEPSCAAKQTGTRRIRKFSERRLHTTRRIELSGNMRLDRKSVV